MTTITRGIRSAQDYHAVVSELEAQRSELARARETIEGLTRSAELVAELRAAPALLERLRAELDTLSADRDGRLAELDAYTAQAQAAIADARTAVDTVDAHAGALADTRAELVAALVSPRMIVAPAGASPPVVGVPPGDPSLTAGSDQVISSTLIGSTPTAPGNTGDWFLVRSDGTIQRFQPPSISAQAYGVIADGVISTCTITAAGNSSFFAAANAGFKAGQMIVINGAGPGGVPLVTTITSVTPTIPNIVNLATPATFAVTNARVFAATDQQPALQAMINALAPTGAIIDLPAGGAIIGLGSPVDFNIKGLNTYLSPLILRGGGSGFGTGYPGAPPSSGTLLLNFGADETILSAYPNAWGLGVEQVAVQNLQDTGPNVAQLYFTNWNGKGSIRDVHCYGTGNFNDNFTGTVVNGGAGADTITGVSTFQTSLVSNVKVGDYVFNISGAGRVVLGTTITAINPVAGTITLSSVGTATAGAATLRSCTPNPGIGLWIDNPQTGGQRLERIYASNFCASQPNFPPPAGAYVGQGVRIGAQTYSVTVTANLQAGSATITGLTSFTGWKPGATVTLTAGGGGVTIPTSPPTILLRVNRKAGTALLSAPCGGSGSAVGATLTMAATAVNSGNVSGDVIWCYGCTVGVRLEGDIGQVDGIDLRMVKVIAAGKGLWVGAAHMAHKVSACHFESCYIAHHLNGCSRVTVQNTLSSKTVGSAGDGSRAILVDNGAQGNQILSHYFEGNGWDIGVEMNGATGNVVTGGWTTSSGGYTPLGQKYLLTAAPNTVVDDAAPTVSENIGTLSTVPPAAVQCVLKNGSFQAITVNPPAATAFTLNAPADAPGAGQTARLVVEVFNNTGGAMGVITWGVFFIFNGFTWVNPAAGKRRAASFWWNGSEWVCVAVTGADY